MLVIKDSYQVNEHSTIESMAEKLLDGEDYDTGSLEAASRTAMNNSRAIGRLLRLLFNKKHIDLKDCLTVLSDYVSESTTIEGEENA